MRVIIAGGRNCNDYTAVLAAISASEFAVETVISGGARGVDALGERYARQNKKPIVRFCADWAKHGRAAGPLRNRVMAENADALVAVWDGVSAGTKHMIETARKMGLPTYVHRL